MTANQDTSLPARGPSVVAQPFGVSLFEWPRVVWLYAIGFICLYVPELWKVSRVWFTNPNYSHGVLILPLSAFVLWLQRDQIRAAIRKPVAWGIAILVTGLLMEIGGTLLQIKYIGMWSLIPALIGAILLLHGVELWKITRFAVCFLIFASQFPQKLITGVGLWIQSASTTGATSIVQLLGVPLAQEGNLIRLTGAAIEVAEVCSGYNKLIALIAFAALYGFMYPLSRPKRLLLVLAAVPVALIVNVLRVAALILITSLWGPRALHIAHDWAETAALGMAFVAYALLGRLLGCETIRFSLQSEP